MQNMSSEDSRSQIQDPDQCTYQGLGSGSDLSAIDKHSKVISSEAFRLWGRKTLSCTIHHHRLFFAHHVVRYYWVVQKCSCGDDQSKPHDQYWDIFSSWCNVCCWGKGSSFAMTVLIYNDKAIISILCCKTYCFLTYCLVSSRIG